ncbi:protein kinase family protein, partial [bacterium]|nr:protein kinase family protein [bacterium]
INDNEFDYPKMRGLEKYTILGEGVQSKVVQAPRKDERYGDIAIKIEATSSEVYNLSILSPQNLTCVIKYLGSDDDKDYKAQLLYMEKADHGNLEDFLKTLEPEELNHNLCFNLMEQIIYGLLQEIHPNNILHLSVKLANIVVFDETNIKFVDFGLSCYMLLTFKREIDTPERLTNLSRIAPRRIKAFRDKAKDVMETTRNINYIKIIISPEEDIWGLYTTLYQLLFNKSFNTKEGIKLFDTLIKSRRSHLNQAIWYEKFCDGIYQYSRSKVRESFESLSEDDPLYTLKLFILGYMDTYLNTDAPIDIEQLQQDFLKLR